MSPDTGRQVRLLMWRVSAAVCGNALQHFFDSRLSMGRQVEEPVITALTLSRIAQRCLTRTDPRIYVVFQSPGPKWVEWTPYN
jgi:hypothetical protein